MTTRRIAVAFLLGAAMACVGGGSGRRGGLPEDQVAGLPNDVKDAYDLFAVRCSRCHTLARPLNASIVNFNQWELYVARMRRHSGSGISPADADKILVFLRYYAEQKAREAEPPSIAPPPPSDPPSDGGSSSGGARVEVTR